MTKTVLITADQFQSLASAKNYGEVIVQLIKELQGVTTVFSAL